MSFTPSAYGYSKKRSRSIRTPLLVVFALFGTGVFVATSQIYQYFFRESDAEPISFSVAEGESFAQVANRLSEADIIPSAWWFRVSAKAAGLDHRIRAGVTTVIPGDRSADILGALLYPADHAEVRITIPEGYTRAQIGSVVRAALPHITLEDWDRVATKDLEGYLFPDTYRFFADASVEDVVMRMRDTMADRLMILGMPSGDAADMTLHELLTLASIIEREVRNPEEMRQVADIFLKRLEIGMALQSDATVNYVTGGNDPSISFTDRDLDSPYNTYQYPGLPPGPISNPGMNALRAVWNPAENDFYYFLTDAEGKVYYAETHDVHVQNKAKYL